MEPIFVGVRARCLRHGRILKAGENECLDCRIIERNLDLNPPFKVLCTESDWGWAKQGEIYEVLWVVYRAKKEHNLNMEGYIFKDQLKSGGGDHVFDVLKFIPLVYLNDDNKDAWIHGNKKDS